ncbi:MAG: 4-hydroxy-3-methylbut-2-enyl diphosphate reductase, partial [Dehalococcoidia bacterium]|nr:4-hydroxy-3-methylbut-2-enyl diphosphate reductase [Dehalococcoidia bacterium]
DMTVLIQNVDDAQNVQVIDPNKVVAFTQTTISVTDTAEIVNVLKKRYPNLVTRNDICYATSNRQDAVKSITKDVDLVMVIGAENSSNCNRLREVAESQGVPAYLVNEPGDIKHEWLDGVEVVGITSGASTPERLVWEVVNKLNPSKVSTVELVEENVSFLLPKSLR